jgi:hypothetical protein
LVTDPVVQPTINPMITTITIARVFDCIEPPSGKRSRLPIIIVNFEAGNEFRTVEILCEKFHARMILAAAEICCPEAVAEIEEAIRLSRTLH